METSRGLVLGGPVAKSRRFRYGAFLTPTPGMPRDDNKLHLSTSSIYSHDRRLSYFFVFFSHSFSHSFEIFVQPPTCLSRHSFSGRALRRWPASLFLHLQPQHLRAQHTNCLQHIQARRSSMASTFSRFVAVL